MNYYKGLPQAVWKSAIANVDSKVYPPGISAPIAGQLNPHAAQAWKFGGFGREDKDRGGVIVYLNWPWFLTTRPVPGVLGGYS